MLIPCSSLTATCSTLVLGTSTLEVTVVICSTKTGELIDSVYKKIYLHVHIIVLRQHKSITSTQLSNGWQ